VPGPGRAARIDIYSTDLRRPPEPSPSRPPTHQLPHQIGRAPPTLPSLSTLFPEYPPLPILTLPRPNPTSSTTTRRDRSHELRSPAIQPLLLISKAKLRLGGANGVLVRRPGALGGAAAADGPPRRAGAAAECADARLRARPPRHGQHAHGRQGAPLRRGRARRRHARGQPRRRQGPGRGGQRAHHQRRAQAPRRGRRRRGRQAAAAGRRWRRRRREAGGEVPADGAADGQVHEAVPAAGERRPGQHQGRVQGRRAHRHRRQEAAAGAQEAARRPGDGRRAPGQVKDAAYA
jgi:hypothetical protein